VVLVGYANCAPERATEPIVDRLTFVQLEVFHERFVPEPDVTDVGLALKLLMAQLATGGT
jgi:hypothetical protein